MLIKISINEEFNSFPAEMSAYFTTETDGMSRNLSSIIQADQSHLAVSAEKVLISEQSKELSRVSTVGFRTETPDRVL